MTTRRMIPIPFIGYIFLLLPVFKPEVFVHLAPSVDRVFDIWRIAALATALGIYIMNRRVSKIMVLIVIFEITRLFSTVINRGDYWSLAVNSGTVLCFCMTMELGLRQSIKRLLCAMILVLGILCTINTITIFLYPTGMYKAMFTENWVLGYDNLHVLYVLPLMCSYVLFSRAGYKSLLRKLCFLVVFSISIFKTLSLTSMIGISLFIILIIMNELRVRPRLLNPYAYIIGTAVLFFLIIIYNIQNEFSAFIANVLHKELSLSERVRAWGLSLRWIAKHPIIGNGVLEEKAVLTEIFLPHCHNYYLQVLYEGGIIGFIGFMSIILMVSHRLFHARRQDIAFILSSYLLSFFVMFQIEAYVFLCTFYGFVVLMYHVDDVARGLEQVGASRRKVVFLMPANRRALSRR